MNELDYAQEVLNEVEHLIRQALITTHNVVVATNKRIIIRFDTEHQANITRHNITHSRRMNAGAKPRIQIEKGLKSTYYYLQLAV